MGCRRLKINPWDGLTGIDLVRLTDRIGISFVVIEEQRIIGQEDFSWGRQFQGLALDPQFDCSGEYYFTFTSIGCYLYLRRTPKGVH